MRVGAFVLFILGIACASGGSQKQALYSTASASTPDKNWVLTWSDEFDGPMGAAPDPAKWAVESGGSGWGNNELECYTPRRKNVRQENGKLVIEARREAFSGGDRVKCSYTSARIKSERRFAQKYGRFEARIRIPHAQGLWPAFWLLGDDFSTAGWPACGEIDIMESTGAKQSTIHATLHGPGYFSGNGLTSVYTLPAEHSGNGFHIFAAEWEPDVIRFYVDDVLYATKTPDDLPSGKRWVFDHPFFVLLNLAVGGDFPGRPDSSTVFPQKMLVDYVRVYALR
ncbi:MAG: glycoside hydrolase family 16 protein [Terriglobales bacterium]